MKLIQKYLYGQSKTIYSLIVKDIYNRDLDLSVFKGEKILLVNIASQCGLTPQLELLEKLYNKYKAQNFHIIAVPSDDFGGQEPLNDFEIITFCESKYSVSFTILKKAKILGSDIHPIYKMLKRKNFIPEWNFHKYLFDRNGILITDFEPGTSPFDENLINYLEN